MAGPSVVFGAIAKATNWTETAYGRVPSVPLPGENREDDTRFNKFIDCASRTLIENKTST